MKKHPKQDEAFLFEQIVSEDHQAFEYADVKARINFLQYEKKPSVKAAGHRMRPQIPAIICCLLLVTTSLVLGGVAMSRRSTVTTPETTVPEETVTHPPVLYPEDTLLWQGDVYIRTDRILTKNTVGVQLGQTVTEIDPTNPHIGRDDPQIAISKHLEEGTPFHRVKAEENCIAISSPDGYVAYQKQIEHDTAIS